jgi:glycosyltransferase involved in cell wall biosynthesis
MSVAQAECPQPSVCILSLSAIADDPRVRRQGEAFYRAGWRVTAVGLPGARSVHPDWPILSWDDSGPEAETGREQASGDLDPPQNALPPYDAVEAAQEPESGSLRRRLLTKLRASPPWAKAFLRPAWYCAIRLLQTALRLWQIAKLVRYLPIRLWYFFRSLPVIGRLHYASKLLAVRLRPALAPKMFWSSSGNIRGIYSCATRVSADVWLANDWTALPIAAKLAAEKGGVYGYDTHEFAAEEYAHQWKWRLWNRPLVCALERRFIQDAAIVSAVCAGIARLLDARYRLPRPSLVIRNTPRYEEAEFRPTGERIRVLYHGIVVPGRGLEAAIDSVPLWRPEFELAIRGPLNPDFGDALRARVANHGISHRVTLLPPVPMTQLVREARGFDVGFFPQPAHSPHYEFVLPNKFFEYVMAGLALCVSDLPEMAGLVRQYDLGVLIASIDPEAIAAAINSLGRERIDAFKRNALNAARELCWEKEAERMLYAYRGAVPKAIAAE